MKLLTTRSGDTPLLYDSFGLVSKVTYALAIWLATITHVNAQKQDYVWCFGDSAGLDFNSGIPVPFQSAMNAHEAAASIAGKQGNLLFYVGDRNFSTQYSNVRNFNHQIIHNGDSLFSAGSVTNGLMIIPFPNDSNKYYLFHRSYPPGHLYYSVIDMSLQGGLGAVDQKNILLIGNANLSERIGAIKHANGRDWWVFIHPYGSNEFQLMLVSPQGIDGPFSQFIGSVYSTLSSFIGEITTSINGDKIAIASSSGFIDVFDFDRCFGVISNWINIGPLNPTIPLNSYYGCEFSENSELLYVSVGEPPYSQLLQYNLFSPTPWIPNYIYTNSNDSVSFGQLHRGPDGKIYMANAYIPNWPNSTFDSLNMYIGVINDPDSIGLACNFTPYSVNLGGRRSFYSLPNMPNYNLGALAGSPCDTLTSIPSITENKQGFEILPNPVRSEFKISLLGFVEGERHFELKIFNSEGQLVFNDRKYNVDDKINFETFSSGLYAITLRKNGQQWYSKFIKL